MYSKLGDGHPLRRMFAGLVEQTFMAELGICDPQLLGYLGDILSEFVHIDDIYRMHSVDGKTIREVSKLRADAQLGPQVDPETRTRVVSRYIGDFTLFWTGIYPEHLHLRRGPNRLREYLLQGKQSYGVASELAQPDSRPPARLLRQLSEEFESCVHGLQLVRAGWETMGRDARQN